MPSELTAAATESDATVPDAVKPPPGNPRFPLFDGLRAIAVLGVFAFHLCAITGHLQGGPEAAVLGQLKAGVALFFLVSAFLLYRPYVAARLERRSPAPLAVYLRRRALRIVPAYFVALTVLSVYPGLDGVFSGDWWVYYGFGQDYQADTVFRGIPPAWSLATEVTFYAFLPLYALLLARPRFNTSHKAVLVAETTALSFLFAGAFTYRALLGTDDYHLSITLPGTFDWFALGMAVAVASALLSHRERQLRVLDWIERFPSLCWSVALAALALDALWQYDVAHGSPYRYEGSALRLSFGVFALFTLLPAAFGHRRRGVPRRLLDARAVAWLGLVSYGIFLYHFPVTLELAERAAPRIGSEAWDPGPTLLLGIVALAVAVGLAAASYYVIERPLLRFKNVRRTPQRAHRPRRAAASSSRR
jgi:peptidoglycan/LPS O-acetylase OafA/YrhL